MTAPLGIIGTGAIGGTLARLAIAAGLDVILANSRGPQTLSDLITQLGPRARAGTVTEVAREADIVVAAIPLSAHPALPADELAGKVVLDTTNYYPQRDGQIPALDDQTSTASELVHAHLANSDLVKAFNNITFASLGNGARPPGAPDRSTLPIAGQSASAKQRATDLLNQLGYDALDIGDLDGSWRSEPGTPIYCDPYMPAWPTEPMPLDQLVAWLLAAPVIPLSRDAAQELITGAERGPAGGYFPETT
ncbi:NAD(P)-binding domain-containing protein [Nocardioides sp. KIGAM211]|uniref:NAD(P)-binding domain-containing protein n=1 Tax=Nocardioides luti TaxID=2761101 RepID=A0A7X0RMI2_9ACTN|nr:NAD(P)-binding domain-containing protein [Nocardioides luti]MBB6629809.1 NAD(P)-binding domain-containing protein [Nocardioides luti]